ncbi:hypothetical protein O3P69_009067 [Scylla paramamosain]|uniref:Uncharacterized protein n=1 Tax=Scylla paramamosain TaxID=85552 RepID=A0AAW0TSZ4_SCYPA
MTSYTLDLWIFDDLDTSLSPLPRHVAQLVVVWSRLQEGDRERERIPPAYCFHYLPEMMASLATSLGSASSLMLGGRRKPEGRHEGMREGARKGRYQYRRRRRCVKGTRHQDKITSQRRLRALASSAEWKTNFQDRNNAKTKMHVWRR